MAAVKKTAMVKQLETKTLKKIDSKPKPKQITAKPAPKKIAAKPRAKQLTTAKTPKQIATKKPAKKITNVEPKRLSDQQASQASVKKDRYADVDLSVCMQFLKKMHIRENIDDLAAMLDKQDAKAVKLNLLKTYRIQKTAYTLKKDGFNTQVIDAVLKKVANRQAKTRFQYEVLFSEIQDVHKRTLTSDETKNTALYHQMFHIMEQLLMIGQEASFHELSLPAKTIQCKDLEDFVLQFMQIAKKVLITLLYRDVEFYESFMYEFCSQYDDVYWKIEQELQMDVADLYIQHQDYQRGDVNYGYLLRENGIRDKVYDRFIHVYEFIDKDKAKGLAHEAARYTSQDSPYYEYNQKILAS